MTHAVALVKSLVLLNLYIGCLEGKKKYVMSFNSIMHINVFFCCNKCFLTQKNYLIHSMINFMNKNVYGITH